MDPLVPFTGKLVALPQENIDTDQIIPARFLKTTNKSGLREQLFADWRRRPDGTLNPDFPLNRSENADAAVLVAGDNFGCGSSREHAAWALLAYGFKAVISTKFADIFRNNAQKNGLLPIEVDQETLQELMDEAQRGGSVTVALETTTLYLPSGRPMTFPIDSFAKHCLLGDVDQLGYLLNLENQISKYEEDHPAPVYTSAESRFLSGNAE